jgi:oxygen-independent coproporphyrinogen-3 oxidase
MFGKKCVNFDFDFILNKWKDNLKRIKKENKKMGLYIHIPYCKSICYFCDCFSKPGLQKEVRQYIDLMIDEIKKFAPIFKKTNFDTLYFGGGTPSMIPENYLNKLLKTIYNYFNLRGSHSSFEGCPQTLSDSKIKILKTFDFTRLTIGVQSFDKKVLELNNRPFASEKLVRNLVEKCKKYGILVNLELICGLKGQSLESFLNDVNKVVKIRPNQVHLYYLECNPATLMWHQNQYNMDLLRRKKRWREIGLRILKEENYKSFPYSGPADQFKAINVQIYNNRIHKSSLLGLGDRAVSNIDNNFRYGSIFEKEKFIYKKVLKRFIKYSEVINI